MNGELRSEVVSSIKVIDSSIEEAVSDNRDFITMDVVDAIDIGCVFKRVLHEQDGINR